MKEALWFTCATMGFLAPLLAEEDADSGNDRSCRITPTAPRSVNMANPQKPVWQAEPHGK